jgi:hypothetical protein
MGTHAMIAIWDNETGTVEASYVHYDGYVEGVGNELIHFYDTNESAAAVATVGYLSSLDRDLETSVENSVHKDQPTVPYESVEQYMKNGYDYAGTEYLYLWDGTAWFVASRYGDHRFTDVVTMLEQEAA